MRLFKFTTHNTSYYFPEITEDTRFLFNLYNPYSLKVKIYWLLWKSVRAIRNLDGVEDSNISEFPLNMIQELVGGNSVMSYTMGTPGSEQKISILGYTYSNQLPFFAKFSQKARAKELSKNEIQSIEKLQTTSFVPRLYSKTITDSYVFFKTEFVEGRKLPYLILSDEVYSLLIKINKYGLTNTHGLINSLSHGDFCPWNILKNKQDLKLIDWEMADIRPLGFDLFTYIFQTTFLFSPETSVATIIKKNKTYVDTYFHEFGIPDFTPYLQWFAEKKVEYETHKSGRLLNYFQSLLRYAKEL